ncbi:Asp-tRNA(Asn)/Glu-tRNA(Gln) amidotransferase subunit GatC [Bacillaceae bacterium]
MSISKEEVLHVANLARLHLTEEEVALYTKQLNDILNFAQKLNELDTEGIEPTSHPFRIVNVLREDEVRPSLSREDALRNAPDAEDGYFRVPAVLEG